MPTIIQIAVRTNSDDAFISWAPSAPIPNCRGFLLERGRKTGAGEVTEIVENRVGFKEDKPKDGDHRPSDFWPFQRFNWTDHAVNVGAVVRYRITALTGSVKTRPFSKGVSSACTPWATLSADVGSGFSCYFNRGLVISQFVTRYLKAHKLTPAKFKAQLKASGDPAFRKFLQGDLGAQILSMLDDAYKNQTPLHAALYELDDQILEADLDKLGPGLNIVLSNGSDKSGDGNAHSRAGLEAAHVEVVDRLLRSKGLGHNKFVVLGPTAAPTHVWTGSTNWSTTGLCTQINNGLLVKDGPLAEHYLKQWDNLRDASPPVHTPAEFTPALIASNDQSKTFHIGPATVIARFTPTSDGRDLNELRALINGAKQAVLFLMFTPGAKGLHTDCAAVAGKKDMYVRGVVSTLGSTAADSTKNFLDVQLVASGQAFKPDRYSIVQPQGINPGLAEWLAETTRKDFLSQVGHAIVHSKVMVIDPFSPDPIVVTGSHNFSVSASEHNDENLLIIRGHKPLAAAYAAHIMAVYSHYRFRFYVRQCLAEHKQPFSYLDDDDKWLKDELASKVLEIKFWTS
jgi:phosphatidylserine/phosphatidylglycerophosphate/cardiolipin synthase-like enzyme